MCKSPALPRPKVNEDLHHGAKLMKILWCQQDDDFFNGFEAIEISIGKRVKVFLWLLS